MSSGATNVPALRWERIRPAVFAALASLGVLVVVVPTVAPSITFGDTAELATVAESLGIGHPPGYPIWCLLNHAATQVMGAWGPAAATNLMSAFLVAPMGLFSFLSFRLASRHDLASLIMAWVFCLTPIVWDQATRAEVYTLDLSLLAAGLYSVLVAFERVSAGRALSGRYALLIGLVLGAGISHRPTQGLILPFYLLMFARQPRDRWLRGRHIVALGCGLGCGLLTWLYHPIRSGAWPGFPGAGPPAHSLWMPIDSWHDFKRHVTAADYRQILWAVGPRDWGPLLLSDIALVGRQLSLPVWLLAAFGIALGRRIAGPRLLPLAGLAAAIWLLFWNYCVPDHDVFFQPLYLAVAGLAAVGLARVAGCLAGDCERPVLAGRVSAGLAVAVPLVWFVVQLPERHAQADRSHETLADEYAQTLIRQIGSAKGFFMLPPTATGPADRIFPLRYYRDIHGVPLFFCPDEGPYNRISAEGALALLGATEEQTRQCLAARPMQSWTFITSLMVDRPDTYVGQVSWAFEHGYWTDCRGWVTRTLSQRSPPSPSEDKAEPWLRWAAHCLKERPDDPSVREMAFHPIIELCTELRVYGEPERAIDIAGRANALDPFNPDVAAALADAEFEAGHRDEAVELLSSARQATLDFNLWWSLGGHLGQMLAMMGRDEEAVECLEQFCALRSRGLADQRMLLASIYRRLGRDADMARVLAPIEDQLIAPLAEPTIAPGSPASPTAPEGTRDER